MTLRTPILAAALFTSVAALGLSHSTGHAGPAPANPGAMPTGASHHSPSKDGRIIVTHPPLREPAAGQLKMTPLGPQWRQYLTGPQWQQYLHCFGPPKPEANCNGYGHAFM